MSRQDKILSVVALAILAVFVCTALARTFIVVQDPNTLKVEMRKVTTIVIEETILEQSDPNHFTVTTRFRINEAQTE